MLGVLPLCRDRLSTGVAKLIFCGGRDEISIMMLSVADLAGRAPRSPLDDPAILMLNGVFAVISETRMLLPPPRSWPALGALGRRQPGTLDLAT
jgi:hypothetical protein